MHICISRLFLLWGKRVFGDYRNNYNLARQEDTSKPLSMSAFPLNAVLQGGFGVPRSSGGKT